MKADGTELQSAPRIISRRPMAPSFRLSASISAATLPEAKEATKASAHGSGSREKRMSGRTSTAIRCSQQRYSSTPAATQIASTIAMMPPSDRNARGSSAGGVHATAPAVAATERMMPGALLHFFTASIDRYASGRAPISSRRELYVSLSSPRFAP